MDWYPWLKAFHALSFIAWMAGLLYLPRLFVYHSGVSPGSEASETFKVMERRLLRAIANPAMIATFAFGIALAFYTGAWVQGWLHAKLALVLGLAAAHGFFAAMRKRFAADRRPYSARFFRVANEVPTLLLIGVVILAYVKPF